MFTTSDLNSPFGSAWVGTELDLDLRPSWPWLGPKLPALKPPIVSDHILPRETIDFKGMFTSILEHQTSSLFFATRRRTIKVWCLCLFLSSSAGHSSFPLRNSRPLSLRTFTHWTVFDHFPRPCTPQLNLWLSLFLSVQLLSVQLPSHRKWTLVIFRHLVKPSSVVGRMEPLEPTTVVHCKHATM